MYATIDSAGKYTGTVYSEMNDNIRQWHAENGLTFISIPTSRLPNIGTDENPDYGAPTAEDVAKSQEEQAILLAKEQASDIARKSAVEQVIDSLPDREVEVLTFLYPPWSGDSLPMAVDQKVRHNGVLYRVIQAHTSQADWPPNTSASLFTRFRDSVAGPQPWVQPQGGHDVYQVGEQVTHNGQTWTNIVNDNVWEPGVYGWEAEL